MSMHPSLAAHDQHALRARNRRFGLFLAVAFLTLVALCAYYIANHGGTNKPPMKPFHSSLRAPGALRAA